MRNIVLSGTNKKFPDINPVDDPSPGTFSELLFTQKAVKIIEDEQEEDEDRKTFMRPFSSM